MKPSACLAGDLSVAQLTDLSPYCRDRAFFSAAVTALTQRHTYDYSIWKWAVAHMDEHALQQLLPMTDLESSMVARRLPVSNLPLMPVSGHDVGVWHLEFWPWVPYCRPIPRGMLCCAAPDLLPFYRILRSL